MAVIKEIAEQEKARLMKWMPDGVTQTVVDEKHLMLKLPELMLSASA